MCSEFVFDHQDTQAVVIVHISDASESWLRQCCLTTSQNPEAVLGATAGAMSQLQRGWQLVCTSCQQIFDCHKKSA